MRIVALVSVCALLPFPIEAQLPEGGPELYEIGCAKCHGSDGRGVDPSLVGFTVPLPDFTDCRFASREASDDWIAVTHLGGPARGFNSTMRRMRRLRRRAYREDHRFREASAPTIRPRGELNFPVRSPPRKPS
jgi:hypothetical protein